MEQTIYSVANILKELQSEQCNTYGVETLTDEEYNWLIEKMEKYFSDTNITGFPEIYPSIRKSVILEWKICEYYAILEFSFHTKNKVIINWETFKFATCKDMLLGFELRDHNDWKHIVSIIHTFLQKTHK